MSMTSFTELIAEDAVRAWLESPGWFVRRGFRIRMVSGEQRAERFIADLRA